MVFNDFSQLERYTALYPDLMLKINLIGDKNAFDKPAQIFLEDFKNEFIRFKKRLPDLTVDILFKDYRIENTSNPQIRGCL